MKKVYCSKMIIFFLTVLFFLPGRLFPLDSIDLTIAEAKNMALEASEDWEIQENERLRGESQYLEVKSAIYPHINGDVNWLKNYLYPDIPQTKFTSDYSVGITVTANQVISTFGKIKYALAATAKNQDIISLQKEQLHNEIIFATKMKYHQAYFVGRVLSIATESYDRAQQNKIILEERSEMGRVSKHDNIKVISDIASRVPTMNDARSSSKTAIETLKTHVGIEKNVIPKLADANREEYFPLDVDIFYEKFIEGNPLLKVFKTSIGIQEDRIAGRRAEYLPTLSLFGACKYKGGGSDFYVGDRNLRRYGEIGIALKMPLFSGGERKQKLIQARLDKSNALLQLRKSFDDLYLDLDKTITEYNEYIKTLFANEAAVVLAEKSFQLSQELFSSGKISVTDLNDAEMMLTNQKMNRERTFFNINISLARVSLLVGEDLL